MLSNLKYWIADNLFCSEMDDAYRLGVQGGTNQALSTLAFRVATRKPQLTPTELKGYLKAIEVMNDSRNEQLDKVGRVNLS